MDGELPHAPLSRSAYGHEDRGRVAAAQGRGGRFKPGDRGGHRLAGLDLRPVPLLPNREGKMLRGSPLHRCSMAATRNARWPTSGFVSRCPNPTRMSPPRRCFSRDSSATGAFALAGEAKAVGLFRLWGARRGGSNLSLPEGAKSSPSPQRRRQAKFGLILSSMGGGIGTLRLRFAMRRSFRSRGGARSPGAGVTGRRSRGASTWAEIRVFSTACSEQERTLGRSPISHACATGRYLALAPKVPVRTTTKVFLAEASAALAGHLAGPSPAQPFHPTVPNRAARSGLASGSGPGRGPAAVGNRFAQA